jgi:class 3 adenylate cyclase
MASPIRAFSRCIEHIFKEDGRVRKALGDGYMFELARLEQAVNAL